MAKHRFYIEGPLRADSSRHIDGAEASHMIKVLRLKVGQSVTLFDGEDHETEAAITAIDRQLVTVSIGEVNRVSRESALKLHLAQGLSKGERMDLVIQKAVELGVTEFTPVITEHTAFSLDKKRMEKKHQHWQKIIENASAQCGRNRLMQLNPTISFKTLLDEEENTLVLLNPRGEKKFTELKEKLASICLLIGPEGGFSDSEVQTIERKGGYSLQLGPRILRTETAAITGVSYLQMQFGDLLD